MNKSSLWCAIAFVLCCLDHCATDGRRDADESAKWRALDQAKKEVRATVKSFYSSPPSHGVPVGSDYDRLSPFLSVNLRRLLIAVREAEAWSASHTPVPDKPIFWEGDMFSSLFEGPTGFEIGTVSQEKSGSLICYLHFSYSERHGQHSVWTDAVALVNEGGRWVIDDVRYLEHENTLRKSLAKEIREINDVHGTHFRTDN